MVVEIETNNKCMGYRPGEGRMPVIVHWDEDAEGKPNLNCPYLGENATCRFASAMKLGRNRPCTKIDQAAPLPL